MTKNAIMIMTLYLIIWSLQLMLHSEEDRPSDDLQPQVTKNPIKHLKLVVHYPFADFFILFFCLFVFKILS